MSQMQRLSQIPPGKKVRLEYVDAGFGLKSRLASMGLVPRIEILVVSSGRPGPIVVSVKDTRLVLGRGMADKIMVSYETVSPQ